MNAIWIPNILTGLRFLFALVFPVVAPDYWISLLTIAFLTEFLDGALARRFHWVTPLGQLLDPVADHLFALSAGLTLMSAHRVLLTQLLLVLTRDFVVTFGLVMALLIFKNIKIIRAFTPNYWGKATTVFQYLVFYDVVLFSETHKWLIWLTGILSVSAAIFYSMQFYSNLKQRKISYGT